MYIFFPAIQINNICQCIRAAACGAHIGNTILHGPGGHGAIEGELITEARGEKYTGIGKPLLGAELLIGNEVAVAE